MAKKRSPGEGSIFFVEDQGLWVAQLYVNGMRKRKSSKKQSVVREWLLKEREAVRDGVFVADESTRMGEFLDSYIRDVAAHSLRPRTLEYYRWCVPKHITPMIGDLRLSELRPSHLQKLYSTKLKEGLSKSTVRHIHHIMHKALDHAVKWGLASRNVSDLVTPPPVRRSAPNIWTHDQAKKFLTHIEGTRYEPIFALALATGMRRGEIVGLHYEDVNWDAGTIHIKRSIQSIIGRGLVSSEPKTGSSKRTVTVPQFALEILERHIEQNRITRGFLFRTSRGTPFSPRNILRYFKAASREAGLPDIRFHDLRHTVASLLLMKGTHPKKVQELLGHSSMVLTLDTYSHLLPAAHDEVAEVVNDLYA